MIPLSLYIHLPWCVQKCPYCDFNSHSLRGEPLALSTEDRYLEALCTNLTNLRRQVTQSSLHSIFIGGGTPSLFSPASIQRILDAARNQFNCANEVEITLEANPGTVDQAHFVGYRAAGVNRLSLGIQSFADNQLKKLGRIHNSQHAFEAYQIARQAGFDNINLDIMYALPEQTLAQGLADLEQAIQLAPEHISWYQLTLEPNTPFAHRPPPLPSHDQQADLSEQGQALLAQHGYQRYEISAYSQTGRQCQHNLNYWEFGDYLGIGAGAHSKFTQADGTIQRCWQPRHPKQFIQTPNAPITTVPTDEIAFEYMLNTMRLQQPIKLTDFKQRTGLSIKDIRPALKSAHQQGLLIWDPQTITLTKQGKLFYNECISHFISHEPH